VRLGVVRRSAGGAQVVLRFADLIPAPWAYLVAAPARVEIAIGEVEFFATQGAAFTL
jgi:hypothetical protein